MPKSTLCCYLIFTGSGPILALSTDPKLTDERLVSKLRDKGIDHLMAYQVDLGCIGQRYDDAFESVRRDLEGVGDLRVLDFNGHQIMAPFSLDAPGRPDQARGLSRSTPQRRSIR